MRQLLQGMLSCHGAVQGQLRRQEGRVVLADRLSAIPCTMVDDVVQVGGKQPRVEGVAHGAYPHDAIPARFHQSWRQDIPC